MRLPTLYIPHGAGPCFFIDMGFGKAWDGLAAWLKQISSKLPTSARALLVISAHWEEKETTVNAGARPALLYDYYGFPPESYKIQYPAPGAPALAAQVRNLLDEAGIACDTNDSRGFDHGVFVPLKLVYPRADIPIVQLSLKQGLDAATHLQIGQALASLRDEGVLIIGSGMSYHNLRNFGESAGADSHAFDQWLDQAVRQSDRAKRFAALKDWDKAPSARKCHPREEHLIPLMVAAGAGDKDAGKRVFSENILGMDISSFQFG